MTIAEKIEMYREKNSFVKGMDNLFKTKPKGSSIEGISYEVYQKETTDGSQTYFYEWLIVHFEGGGKSARTVNGNSNLANFGEVGKLMYGGYYDENEFYDCITEKGWERVVL